MLSKMAAVDVAISSPEEMNDSVESTDDFNDNLENVYAKMREISSLTMMARFQAKEAEVRARYAMEFAQRAISEAKSAHQVSETLARTSRVVAALALEFSNSTDEYLDELDQFESRRYQEDSSFADSETSPECTREKFTGASDLSTTSVELSDAYFTPEQHRRGNLTQKYDTPLPDEMPTGDSKRIVSKMSSLFIDGKTDASPKSALCDELDRMETKRRMTLYRDSKMINALRMSFETGDAQPRDLTYEERATQTGVSGEISNDVTLQEGSGQ